MSVKFVFRSEMISKTFAPKYANLPKFNFAMFQKVNFKRVFELIRAIIFTSCQNFTFWNEKNFFLKQWILNLASLKSQDDSKESCYGTYHDHNVVEKNRILFKNTSWILQGLACYKRFFLIKWYYRFGLRLNVWEWEYFFFSEHRCQIWLH